MNLDDLLNEMSEKIRNRDLSDKYLREHNNSTREEIGIGEYAYGITMIPCEWVYEYLSDYKRVLKENELLRKDIEGWEKYCEEINEEQTKMSNKNCELEFEVEKLQKENEELKDRIREHTMLISPYYVKENYIPVQNVKDKIEKILNNGEYIIIFEGNADFPDEATRIDAQKYIKLEKLQELLEGRK